MFQRKFNNPPGLVAAISALGATGFTNLLMAVEWGMPQKTWSEEQLLEIHRLLSERLKPLFSSELTTRALHQSFYNMYQETKDRREYWGYAADTKLREEMGCMARAVLALDTGADIAASMISKGNINWDLLFRNERAVLDADPEYQVFELKWYAMGTHRRDSDLGRLFDCSIGRIALKETKKDIAWCKGANVPLAKHVMDWIKSAYREKAEWLTNVDEQGRPKKLMKFGTLEAMNIEAEKHMQWRLEAARRKQALDRLRLFAQGDEEVFSEDGGPYRLVRMKTPEALDVESSAMRHCVGHGAYDDSLDSENTMLLSLRDDDGLPHLTIEMVDGVAVQMMGKANTPPKEEYAAAFMRLIAARPCHVPACRSVNSDGSRDLGSQHPH